MLFWKTTTFICIQFVHDQVNPDCSGNGGGSGLVIEKTIKIDHCMYGVCCQYYSDLFPVIHKSYQIHYKQEMSLKKTNGVGLKKRRKYNTS